jgi:hypothetical protein
MEFRVVIVLVVSLSLIGGAFGESRAQTPGGAAAISVTLKVDASAAVLFADMMKHIRTENDDFFAKGIDVIPAAMVSDRVNRNRRDPQLSEMIDSLLSLPAYAELSRIMRSFAPEKLAGRSAYREALYRLPWMRTRLMGGVGEQYMELLRKFDTATEERVADLAERIGSEAFAAGVRSKVAEWLPPSLAEDFHDTVTVYVYLDGNRGCFRKGGSIYIDLMQSALSDLASDSACAAMIGCSAAHELHHIIYGNWLAGLPKDDANSRSWRDRALKDWRDAVLTEGAARFCDRENLPDCARQMAVDERLGEEIFATWESVFLRLSKGDIPENEYLAMKTSFEQDRALKWFKQYLTAHYAPSTARSLLKKYPAYRPVPHYYVGYRIFSEILDTGGKSAFFYAMLHPDEFLDIYYDAATADNQAPQISEEAVARWAGL